jgi:ribose transport system substrate-binding protein
MDLESFEVTTRLGNVPLRRRARHALLAVLLIVAMTLGSRASAAQPATPGTPPATPVQSDPSAGDLAPVRAAEPYRLLLLVPFPEDPFWHGVQEAVIERAATDGVAVDVVALSTPSVPEQIAQIENGLAQGYDGILLGPVDATAVAPGIAAANAAGIPVLAIDTAPIGGEVISVVRTDNVAATRLAGQLIGAELDGQGTVLNIQGDLATVVGQERDQGLREGLTPFPEITLVSTEGNWNRGTAYGQTMAQLPRVDEGTPMPPVPLVNAVFAADPAMALGAAQAVEDAKADSVVVFGFGATDETLEAVRNGTVEAVVAELPQRAGVLAVDAMVRHLNGESIPPVVDSGFSLVTRDTLEEYVAASSA